MKEHMFAEKPIARKSAKELRRYPQREWTWLALSVLLLVGIVLAGWGIDAFLHDKSRLCIVITGLFFLGVVRSYLDIRFIQNQRDLANQQLVAMEAAPGIQMFLRACIPGVFRDHVSNLYEIYRRDNSISQDNLIGLLQTKMQARTRFTEQLATVMVTLGLVGTIVGLVFAVQPLADAFAPGTQGNTEQVMQKMALVMESMKTAFYTTLFGAVMGGVALRLLHVSVDSNSENLVGHIAELCEVHLLPAMRHAANDREVVPLDEIPQDIDLRKYGLR
jgi:hypothetical protein